MLVIINASVPVYVSHDLRISFLSLQWCYNEHDGVSNHQPHGCLLKRLFRRRSKKTPKLRVTGHCAGNSPVTGEFPAQRASSVKNVSLWWRHHFVVDIYSIVPDRAPWKRTDLYRWFSPCISNKIQDYVFDIQTPFSKQCWIWLLVMDHWVQVQWIVNQNISF